MNINILVAIIALVSAILGAVVTAVVNYRFQQRSEIREKQRDVYFDFLDALQSFKNSSKNEDFCRFLSAVNAVCLYGDNETSSAVKSYFDVLVRTTNEGNSLQAEEHVAYETKIINAMRDNFNLKKFDRYDMVKFEMKNN